MLAGVIDYYDNSALRAYGIGIFFIQNTSAIVCLISIVDDDALTPGHQRQQLRLTPNYAHCRF